MLSEEEEDEVNLLRDGRGAKEEGDSQLLRCGTSIGANVREGLYGQSRKDFISKLHIALKEAGETDYWLDVIHSAEYFTDEEYQSLKADNFPSKREQSQACLNYVEREESQRS